MAIQKFLAMVNGIRQELSVGISASTGASDADKVPVLGSNGRLDNSFMPTGIGADTASILTSEALTAGDFVNIYSNAGTANVRKAVATGVATKAMGFVLASVSSGAQATVYFEGSNTSVTGQTPGSVYLSTTPGQATTTPPSGAGNIVQQIGFATSSTSVNCQIDSPTLLS